MRTALIQNVPIALAWMAWAEICGLPEYVLGCAITISITLVVILFMPADDKRAADAAKERR